MGNELNLVETETAEREAKRIPVAKPPPDPEQTRRELKSILEAVLFASPEPLPLAKLKEAVTLTHKASNEKLVTALAELEEEYKLQGRAVQIDQIEEGYLLRTRDEYAPYLQRLQFGRKGEKLSRACQEVLAIIAYKQPITRPNIEAIRGVDSSGTVAVLLERELIEPVGRLEAPGRPSLYGTTRKFLQHFGLRSTDELPEIETT